MDRRHYGLLCGFLASGAVVGIAQAADGVPNLNVRQSCREAQAISADGETRNAGADGQPDTFKACMQDEQQARDQLAQRWSKFKPVNRQSCVAQANPSPSYVEILTCLEMNDEAGIPYKADGNAIVPVPGRPAGSSAPATGSPAPATGGRI